jgi:hypothetical protein
MKYLMKIRKIKKIAFIAKVIALLVGIVLSIGCNMSSQNNNSNDENVVKDDSREDNFLSTIMGEVNTPPGEIIDEKSFKVFDVYTPCAALVRGKSEGGGYYGIIYLLVRDKYYYVYNHDSEFYDDQIVKVPKGKVARMFGTHSYTTTDGRHKTVPRIMIVDK